MEPKFRQFDAATQFGEWLAFLDEPAKPEVKITNVLTEIERNGSACLRFKFGALESLFLRAVEIDALYAASQAARGIEPDEFDKVAYLESLRPKKYAETIAGVQFARYFDAQFNDIIAAEKAKLSK